jgi:hypothetical protein
VRWQEILVGLQKTFKASTFPEIKSKAITNFKDLFFPNEYETILTILQKLGGQRVEGESLYLPAFLALCGWLQKQDTNESYYLECPSCLRKV